MADLSALILAAGRGVRMGPRGRLTPKGLLEIEGTPLVARSVNLLRARGIRHIRIVTGHLNDQYEAIFAAASDVELIHNPIYDTTGSLRSLVTGLDGVSGHVVVLESDVIYEARALSPVVAGETRLIVSGETNATDEVYVWSRPGANGAPAFDTMSKDINAQPAPHFGELLGITCFSAAQVLRLRAAAQTVLAEDRKADYESAVIELARDTDIEAVLLEDLAWTEIDDETMFARAINTVWPQIVARDGIKQSA
ncbi:phosphocholine cytidylyltransferase family protein [Shimia abyssi]|uniref:Choline kinase n=1 Tax=Shimia abyssi TaxID=1662395 RepID=A0A2P8FAH6_9RHOB|nr:phosphocholine cytidylyltransferase family protein [Shimia abyssi]PSL18736.1 choline kinase [Shimia abyssi]